MPLSHQDSIGSLVNEVPQGKSVESAMAFVPEDTATPVEHIVHDHLYTKDARPNHLSGQLAPAFRCTSYPSLVRPKPFVIITVPPRNASLNTPLVPVLSCQDPKTKRGSAAIEAFPLRLAVSFPPHSASQPRGIKPAI